MFLVYNVSAYFICSCYFSLSPMKILFTIVQIVNKAVVKIVNKAVVKIQIFRGRFSRVASVVAHVMRVFHQLVFDKFV